MLNYPQVEEEFRHELIVINQLNEHENTILNNYGDLGENAEKLLLLSSELRNKIEIKKDRTEIKLKAMNR